MLRLGMDMEMGLWERVKAVLLHSLLRNMQIL
jgi:hypothetical protein